MFDTMNSQLFQDVSPIVLELERLEEILSVIEPNTPDFCVLQEQILDLKSMISTV